MGSGIVTDRLPESTILNGVDLDFENANFYASKKLDKTITAVYLPCPQELLHVSSSMVRSSLQFKTPISDYVSEGVEEYIYSSNCFET